MKSKIIKIHFEREELKKFHSETIDFIRKRASELNINYSEAIGVLEIIKIDIYNQMQEEE